MPAFLTIGLSCIQVIVHPEIILPVIIACRDYTIPEIGLMKIALIIPGSCPNFYCENCARDANLIQALRKFNNDPAIVPMYLPLISSGFSTKGDTRVFFWAVNIYLKHKIPFLRRSLPGMDRILDSPFLLKYAAKKAGATRSSGLGEITIFMLRGEEGDQAGELEKLVKTLRDEIKPEVVHLSNALLLGLAQSIKNELKVPIACSLQDEDTWINEMDKRHIGKAWDLLAEKSLDVDAFLPVSDYYADFMQERLQIPSDRLHVVHPGVDPGSFKTSALSFDPPVLGYLSRMSQESGLGRLVDAFIQLKKDRGLKKLKLSAAGGHTGDDRRFIKKLKKKLLDRGMLADVEFHYDSSMQSYINILNSISVLSVPKQPGGAFGLYLIEALASGVPVVQPETGAFPEIISKTGGGVIYNPADAGSLVNALASLLNDPERARELGMRGRKAIERNFNLESIATKTVEIYNEVAGVLSLKN